MVVLVGSFRPGSFWPFYVVMNLIGGSFWPDFEVGRRALSRMLNTIYAGVRLV